MCVNCWADHGRPTDWNADVQRAIELIGAIYEEESTGGPLHLVIDDWNISGEISVYESSDFSAEVMGVARELVELFNRMPEGERASALAYADGYVTAPA